ncbi:3-deoxy-D-manno-octulosonic acid transferase [Thalassobaculum sp. OXR-137]|uniref:3-deoxy-D-manno-octulosonic acid transferase n=1 Tax=Thalassobaculum sp. OXR-137 TaxID=3100173 RepID=UPI002AC9340B|nr:3-deoxy-D-manno-octulosonic acid transferase [Thalassobaculum sp. OXR-137]WPZ35779.1 3-deoxy-D-manno-octulosonic acid transferase [Thalassobaculum sp. OXR-137]
MILSLYKGLATALGPAIDAYLDRRVARGKEDPRRLDERRGVADRPRPDGPLVWLHAASVGEAVGLLTLIRALRQTRPDLTLLMTTGTTTSADAMARRLPEGVIHQFVPVDRPAWVGRFLDHWRPDLGIWMESDLWPTLVTEADGRGIPLVIVDGRLSVGAFQRWRRMGWLARPLFGAFDLVLAASADQARRFSALGCADVRYAGNLKAAGDPPEGNEALTAEIRAAVAGRPVWLAASTHPGEDAVVLDAHARLASGRPDLLTVIIPRHVTRADEIAGLIRAQGLTAARRSAGETVTSGTAVYLADTMGEVAGFYSAIPVTFLAGSLVPVGGHNPIEPAHCGTALVFGPLIPNNRDAADALLAADAAREVTDAESLAQTVGALLDSPESAAAMGGRARAVAAEGRAGLVRILDALTPLLPGGPR